MALLETLLALGAIVALHEFGHLLLARACRMRVDRYSIGFGPVLLSYKHRETEYALSLLPFGGYVKIAGMNPEDGTAADDPRSYSNRPAWQRFVVLAAGPFTNYMLAFITLACLNFFGMPRPVKTPTIGEVTPNSAAAVAGLKPGDTILSIGGNPVNDFTELRAQIQATEGKPSPVRVARSGHELELSITPRKQGSVWILGMTQKTEQVRKALGPSIEGALAMTVLANPAIILGIVDWIRGRGNVEVGGTVAAVAQTMQAAEAGAAIFFLQVAELSVAVGLFNLLPVPALDGGRIVFVLFEMIRRRPVNPRLETAVHAIGFLLLLGLIVFLTIGDVRKRLPAMGYFGGQSAAVDAGR